MVSNQRCAPACRVALQETSGRKPFDLAVNRRLVFVKLMCTKDFRPEA